MTENIIKELTPEQKSKMPEYKDRWIKKGLSTEPCNFEESKKYVIMAYEAAGLPAPTKFLLAKGPLDAIEIIKGLYEEDGESVESMDILNEMSYGSHDTGWLSFYSFMLEELNIKDCEKLLGLMGLADHCGWWSSYTNKNGEGIVIFQDRLKTLHLNEEGAMHCENGPSSEYGDGMRTWHIDGHEVTEQIVLRPETLTIKDIHSQQNSDVQSIMINRFGWPEYLIQTQAVLLDAKPNLIEGTKEALYQTESHGVRFLATCPTARLFSMGMPDNIESCEQARKWIGNQKEGDNVNMIART